MAAKKYIFAFEDGDGKNKLLLGGKGANLAEMASLGLPVPPGFTITTDTCAAYYDCGGKLPKGLMDDVQKNIKMLEKELGKKFGSDTNPLLVSVRSGARASMPGMMDTVLNLGLNDVTVEALAANAGDERFAWDSYRRFIQMYSNVVLDVEHHNFEEILEDYKDHHNYMLDTDLTAADWREVIKGYKAKVQEATGKPFPQDPKEQLWGAIGAVFGSWMNQRAIVYRKKKKGKRKENKIGSYSHGKVLLEVGVQTLLHKRHVDLGIQ